MAYSFIYTIFFFYLDQLTRSKELYDMFILKNVSQKVIKNQ